MSKKDWDVAWPPQKIRQNVEKWKLSGDAGLLLFLEQSSNKLSEHFRQTKIMLENLENALQFTGIRLENTINDFSMLSNKQFIENRVYDEDVSTLKPKIKTDTPDNAKSKEEREAEMTEAIKYSLQKGCSMIDCCFEKIEIRPEDFDEVDDPTFKPDPIYEPKDQFVKRPLPFIIGTSLFENFRYIGLKEEKQNVDEENVSEEEEEEIFLPPPPVKIQTITPTPLSVPEKTPQTSSSSVPQLIAAVIRKENGPGSDNSGLFCGSAESDKVEPLFSDHEKEKPLVPDLKSELNAKINRNEDVPGPSTSKPSTIPRKSSAQKKDHQFLDDDDLFGPPPLLPNKDEEDEDKSFFGSSLFKPKSRGLFDDDEEEDSLFTPNLTIRSVKSVDTVKPSKETTKLPPVDADLFFDSAVKMSDTVKSSKEQKASIDNKKLPASQQIYEKKSIVTESASNLLKSTGLFDDEEEDDLLFSPKTKQNVTKSKEPTKTVNKNLFGSDEEDLFDRALPTKSATGADVNKDDLFCDKEVKKEHVPELNVKINQIEKTDVLPIPKPFVVEDTDVLPISKPTVVPRRPASQKKTQPTVDVEKLSDQTPNLPSKGAFDDSKVDLVVEPVISNEEKEKTIIPETTSKLKPEDDFDSATLKPPTAPRKISSEKKLNQISDDDDSFNNKPSLLPHSNDDKVNDKMEGLFSDNVKTENNNYVDPLLSAEEKEKPVISSDLEDKRNNQIVENVLKASVVPAKIVSQKESHNFSDDEDLFSGPPLLSNKDIFDFGSKGIKSGGLFDDDEDDDDFLFAPKLSTGNSKLSVDNAKPKSSVDSDILTDSGAKPVVKSISSVPDDNKNIVLFDEDVGNKKVNASDKTNNLLKSKSSSLFDDDDENDALFSSNIAVKKEEKTVRPVASVKSKTVNNLFGDDDDDDLFS